MLWENRWFNRDIRIWKDKNTFRRIKFCLSYLKSTVLDGHFDALARCKQRTTPSAALLLVKVLFSILTWSKEQLSVFDRLLTFNAPPWERTDPILTASLCVVVEFTIFRKLKPFFAWTSGTTKYTEMAPPDPIFLFCWKIQFSVVISIHESISLESLFDIFKPVLLSKTQSMKSACIFLPTILKAGTLLSGELEPVKRTLSNLATMSILLFVWIWLPINDEFLKLRNKLWADSWVETKENWELWMKTLAMNTLLIWMTQLIFIPLWPSKIVCSKCSSICPKTFSVCSKSVTTDSTNLTFLNIVCTLCKDIVELWNKKPSSWSTKIVWKISA